MAGGAFIFITLCFAIAGGIVGRMKGGSFLLWFLVSAIPPYIGLVAAILHRSEHDEPRGTCPTCGKQVMLHDALCTRCGSELSFPGDPETAGRLGGSPGRA